MFDGMLINELMESELDYFFDVSSVNSTHLKI